MTFLFRSMFFLFLGLMSAAAASVEFVQVRTAYCGGLKFIYLEADAAKPGNGDGKVNYAELKKYLELTLTYFAHRHYGREQTAQFVVG